MTHPPYGLVYLVTNLVNGKGYVGQTTVPLPKRWQRHCWACATKSGMPIALAIKKYGRDKFTIEPLEECSNQAELDAAEIYWANDLKTFSPNGYNLRAGKGPGTMSEETKRKISAALRGRPLSDAHRKALSVSHQGNRQSPQAKRKLSMRYRGRRLPASAYENSARATAKTFHLIAPDGTPAVIINMRKHCRQQGLSPHKMSEVVHGKRLQHKGWRRWETDQ